MSPEPSRAHVYVQQQLAELLGPLARAAGLVPGIGGFNLGTENDYRAPDGGLFDERSGAVWTATARLVLEIVSPGDESWEKPPFFAARDVDEVLIIDPAKQTVAWLALREGEYQPVERSGVVELGSATLAELIDWP